VGLIARFVAAQDAKRKRTINQQCRVDELRLVLRRGDTDERRIYQTAASAWDEAGQPDVPLITEWFAKSQAGVSDAEIAKFFEDHR
jgi:hypothetical protein